MKPGAAIDARRRALLPHWIRRLAPLLLATTLFTLNNLGLLSARLHPPSGTLPMFGFHTMDIAMYITWIRTFQQSWTVPNFAVPWPTQPGFFNLLFFVIARLADLFGADPLATTLAVQFLCYVAGAYGVFFAFRVFLRNSRQRKIAAALVLCCVPVPSLLVLPSLLAGRTWPLPGIGYFVWASSDGFYHGIAGSVLVTFGTAGALISIGLLGAYMRDGERRWLVWASLVTFTVTYIHSNEGWLIVASSAAAVILRPPKSRGQALRDMAPVWFAAVMGLVLLALPTFKHPWLRQLAAKSRGDSLAPIDLFVSIGLPALLCLLLLLLQRSRALATGLDVLLTAWFVTALASSMLPLLPTPQHCLDGFQFVSGLLLTRLLPGLRTTGWRLFRPISAVALGVCCIASLSAYLAYSRQGYLDGATLTPRRLCSAVAPVDEVNLIEWFRAHADPSKVVLAPIPTAPWVATAPIHTISAHWVWGYDPELTNKTESFFSGKMSCADAGTFLTQNNVRYVVTDAGADSDCLANARLRATFGSFRLYEAPPVALQAGAGR